MKLYELTYEIEKTLNDLNDDDLNSEEIQNALAPLTMEFKTKAINVSSYIKNLEAMANAVKEVEDSMAERRKKLQRKIDSIKDYLKFNMIRTDITKISCNYFDISLRKTKGKVVIDNEDSLPDEFIRLKIIKEADKIKLKEYLENQTIPPSIGAHLEESYSLIIK